MSRQQLITALNSAQAAFIVGTGVTMSATDGADCASWVGLIDHGIKFARGVNDELDTGWEENVAVDLERGRTGHPDSLVSAAQKVSTGLSGPRGVHFRSWLTEAVGSLSVQNDSVIKLLATCAVPILTTNYDTIIEDTTKFNYALATDTQAFQLALSLRTTDIIHLHGCWRTPESVVFGAESYGATTSNTSLQSVMQALTITKSLILVGFGQGLEDPNFSQLLKWLRTHHPNSAIKHFLLCREAETAALRDHYRETSIVPVAYGDNYDDLPRFLTALLVDAPSLVDTSVVRKYPPIALEALEAKVREETILADFMAEVGSKQIDQLLIPPILLPVPSEEFAESLRGSDEHGRLTRCDASEEAEAGGMMVVVGDGSAGLSSALHWLIAKKSSIDGDTSPVALDFSQLSAGLKPIERLVRRELGGIGIDIGRPSSPLPKLAISIDNVVARTSTMFSRMVEELPLQVASMTIIGCRTGTEKDLSERLTAAGVEFRVRYLGRLNKSDAASLARLVAPSQAVELANRALAIASKEYLLRTPLTIALLLNVLLRGDLSLSAASETALLDAYVSLLLGRGDPHDDARLSLDSRDREEVLSAFAAKLVELNVGSLREAQVIEVFANMFESVGWSDDPMDVLIDLRNRHVLSISSGLVRFSQSTFLHLFTAKYASTNEQFKSSLLDKPLYYAGAIRHYAALARNDGSTLDIVSRLLWSASTSGEITAATTFEEVPPSHDLIDASNLDEFVHRMVPEVRRRPLGDAGHTEPKQTDTDWLDSLVDLDPDPFPSENLEDGPPMYLIFTTLALVSNVIRDSDMVRDLDLKRRVLARTLTVYGQLAELLDQDEDFQQYITSMISKLLEPLELKKGKLDELVAEFARAAGILTSFGAMMASLSSRKLSKILSQAFEDPDISEDVRAAVMGALLSFDLHEEGWAALFVKVHERFARVGAVSNVLRRFAEMSYYAHSASPADDKDIELFLAAQITSDYRYNSNLDQKNALSGVVDNLRVNRRTMQMQELAAKRRNAL